VKLNLQELKAAMSPLSEIGKGELSFDVNGLVLVLRALTPEEEIHVQRYARQALTDGDTTDQTNALEYLDRFRICSLGYALVQAGDIDFRGVEFIETGDKLANGTAIKVRKHEAVMQLVQAWSRNMVNAVFKKFGELQNRVEKEVEGLIEFDEVDYDAEISRLEDRIRELKESKTKAVLSTKDPRTDTRKQVVASNKTVAPINQSRVVEQSQLDTGTEYETVASPSDIDREVVDDPDADDEDEDEGSAYSVPTEDVEEPPAPVREAPVAATRSSLFDRVRNQAPATQAAPPSRPAQPDPAPVAPPSEPASFDEVPHSFVDPGDPESMERAVAEENRRLMAQRSGRSAVPHLAAKRTAEDLAIDTTGPKLAGQMGGMEVYKMPTQTMTDRKPPTAQPATAPSPTTKNPKFRPIR
jgi:hypothetical protein